MAHYTRIYLPSAVDGLKSTLSASQSHYLRTVMRAKTGSELLVFDGNGNEFSALVTDLKKTTGTIVISHKIRYENPAPLYLILAAAISRHTRMEWMLEKAVELGVDEIYPLQTRKSTVRLSDDRMEKKLAHWTSIIVAAASQSGRCRLPILHPPRELVEQALAVKADRKLLFLPEATTPLPRIMSPESSLALMTGPESGFDETEKTFLIRVGWNPVRLGPHTLRAETAAPAALAAIQVLWGEWKD